MMCFRDRSYCSESSNCGNAVCGRKLSEEDKNKAGNLGLFIAYAPYRDSLECPGFMPKLENPEKTENV